MEHACGPMESETHRFDGFGVLVAGDVIMAPRADAREALESDDLAEVVVSDRKGELDVHEHHGRSHSTPAACERIICNRVNGTLPQASR